MEIEVVLNVITGGPLTVRVALCDALPQVPVVVTLIGCAPGLNEPVGTVMLALSPLNGEPSNVHA